MVVWIILGTLTSAALALALGMIIYSSIKENNPFGWLGMVTTIMVVLCICCWSTVAHYREPVIHHAIEDVISCQVDTTFIINSDKIDTLYTINYETVNKESQDYRESK